MSEASNAATLKRLTDQLEAAYQQARALSNRMKQAISAGRATCQDIVAYNLLVSAIYNTQKGILTTIRAMGGSAPALPITPTYFTIGGGVVGSSPSISCGSGLSGALRGVLKESKAAAKRSEFLDPSMVQVIPERTPVPLNVDVTLAQLTRNATGLGGELGAVWIFIIAAVAVTLASGVIIAVMNYLRDTNVSENTLKQTETIAKAIDTSLVARIDCYNRCVAQGKTPNECSKACASLIPTPSFPGGGGGGGPGEWGFWTWAFVGSGVILGGAWLYRNKRRTGSWLPWGARAAA